MTTVVIDIETKADPEFFEKHGDWCFSRIEPDGRLTRPETYDAEIVLARAEYDQAERKLEQFSPGFQDTPGYMAAERRFKAALKHMEKLAESQVAARHRLEADIEAQKATLVERAPLSPFAGKVVAIGVGNLYADDITVFASNDERLVLLEFAKWCEERVPIQWCGFNIRSFDLPFLAIRFARHNLDWPGHYPARNDYRWCVDVLDLTRDISPARGGSCDWHLRGMGLPPKTDSGANVANMNIDEIRAYCASDVERERLLLRRLANYFHALRGDR